MLLIIKKIFGFPPVGLFTALTSAFLISGCGQKLPNHKFVSKEVDCQRGVYSDGKIFEDYINSTDSEQRAQDRLTCSYSYTGSGGMYGYISEENFFVEPPYTSAQIESLLRKACKIQKKRMKSPFEGHCAVNAIHMSSWPPNVEYDGWNRSIDKFPIIGTLGVKERRSNPSGFQEDLDLVPEELIGEEKLETRNCYRYKDLYLVKKYYEGCSGKNGAKWSDKADPLDIR